ncbi:MATE family efflux transporter [Vaginisenegalia massiliensis]|uniref:MATE family efflux transporter n=1 Tax=Vaginisenegalia massiliensis TaxID=2058294 RepID=UPI000F549E0F|nr:MATE family efflux transporter [Vaginisenegalia massiliensis]
MSQTIKDNPMGYLPIPSLLRSMAIPAIIANLANAFYNIIDQIFIGQGVGYLGNAATSIAFPLTTVCLAIGLTIGIGSAANFNLELGRQNPDRARKIAGTAFSSLLLIGTLLAVAVLIFLKPIMLAFGATAQILPYALEYAGVTALGLPFLLFSIGANALVRADGNAKYSMFAVLIGAVLNAILDPLFIFQWHMGIAGAAIATVISQIVSATFLLAYLRHFRSVRFRRSDFIPRFGYFKTIVSLGFASFVFQFSTMLIQIVTNILLKQYGATSIYGSDIPIAVAGIVMKINVIFMAIIIGIVQGSQPVNGYNYGARQFDRVREMVYLVLKVTFVISIVAFLIFQIFPKEIMAIFGKGDQRYYQFAVYYMRVVLMMTGINGVQVAAATFFPSIGKAGKGAIISLTKQMIFLMPLLVGLPMIWGLDGIIFATPLADLLSCLCATTFLYFELKQMPKQNLTLE